MNAFEIRKVVIARARAPIGTASYRRNALLDEAPHVFNCYRLTQWAWRAAAVVLPDHQLVWGDAITVSLEDAQCGDLVFTPRLQYSIHDDDFGHVGLLSDVQTVIHATKWKNTVVEESLPSFIKSGLLGVRRIPESSYCHF